MMPRPKIVLCWRLPPREHGKRAVSFAERRRSTRRCRRACAIFAKCCVSWLLIHAGQRHVSSDSTNAGSPGVNRILFRRSARL